MTGTPSPAPAAGGNPAEWAKAHPKVAFGIAAAGVAGVAFIQSRKPADQVDTGATDPAAAADGTAPTDVYNELQPELENVGDRLDNVDQGLADLGDQLGAGVPGGRRPRPRPTRPQHPGPTHQPRGRGHHGAPAGRHHHGKPRPKRPERPKPEKQTKAHLFRKGKKAQRQGSPRPARRRRG